MVRKEQIEDALMELGVTPRLKGFNHIVDSVFLIDKDNSYIGEIGELREAIALQNSITPSKVEKNMRHALNIALKSDDEILCKYFKNVRKGQANLLSMLYMQLKRGA